MMISKPIVRRDFLTSAIVVAGGLILTSRTASNAATAEPTEGLATVKGTDLFYRIEGVGEPLLLIAGFSCDVTIWDALVPSLRDRFRIIRFDNRGIGRSGSNADKTVDVSGLTTAMMADDAAALLSALQIERAHILGHSMGGQIAQELSLRTPSRVATLSLLSCWARPDARLAWLIRLFGDLAAKLGPEDYARVLLPWMFTDGVYNAAPQAMESAVQQWANNPDRPTPALLRAQGEAILATDTSARLGQIDVPTFVAVGAGDTLTPPRLSQDLAKGIPDSIYAEINASAHACVLDAAPQIAEQLIGFLAAHRITSERTGNQRR